MKNILVVYFIVFIWKSQQNEMLPFLRIDK